MGCRTSKPQLPPETHAEINLFGDEKVQEETTTGADSSSLTTTEHGNKETHTLSLDDEYTFDELIKKDVYTVGNDCIFQDDMGLVCGRLSRMGVAKTCLEQTFIYVQLMTIRSNGSTFFRNQVQKYIMEYDGKKNLGDLNVRPVMAHEKARLKERGRAFVKYGLGSHHLMYTDKMFLRGSCGKIQISAEGRVMVDTSSFLHFNPNYGVLGQERRRHCGGMDPFMMGDNDHCDPYSDRRNKGRSSTRVPDSSLHLCWPSLCGFSLKAKRWGELCLAFLKEIEFSDAAFDQLVMAPEPKNLVRGLVANMYNKENQHDSSSSSSSSLLATQPKPFTDIIQGKGGGCIFLLHGPPGVGKTLTAEAVSESLHRPLYCIDVGELGITPEALEDRLKRILEVAERWKAVVLIDECDIFLARRTKDDVLRNAMVGIFLRLLEYYHGILFLTSNRADEMDEAFQSRISVSLGYDNLDVASRKLVWHNLLEAAGVIGQLLEDNHNNENNGDGNDDSLDALAVYELNGRQIKSAIRLGMSLASTAQEPLRRHHLEQTISYISK